MSTNLGKRKRTIGKNSIKKVTKREERSGSEESESVASEPNAQEIFRRHFEAQFKPLPVFQKAVEQVVILSEDEEDSEEEWGGISEPDNGGVEVVEHMDAQTRMAAMSKEELKAFMVRQIPLMSFYMAHHLYRVPRFPQSHLRYLWFAINQARR